MPIRTNRFRWKRIMMRIRGRGMAREWFGGLQQGRRARRRGMSRVVAGRLMVERRGLPAVRTMQQQRYKWHRRKG